MSPQELATYYAAASICVVPSLYNPSGKIVLEAMASVIPVIAADIDGLEYVIAPNQTGLLYPAENSFDLTRAIHNLAIKPEIGLDFAVAARFRVEELFTWDIVAEQISEFYLEQINQHNLEFLAQCLQHSFRDS